MARPFFRDREMIRRIPREAVRDCSGPGDATESVAYWVGRLNFTAPADYMRDYLAGFGAWDTDDLADDTANLQRLFWIICGHLSEDARYPIYLER